MRRQTVAILSAMMLLAELTASGQQVPADTGPVRHTSRAITGWATVCTVQRGYVRIDDPAQGHATTGSPSDATGIADNFVVSLGDGEIGRAHV